jgi:hypothetical protein
MNSCHPAAEPVIYRYPFFLKKSSFMRGMLSEMGYASGIREEIEVEKIGR